MTISKIVLGLAAATLLASCGGSDHKNPPKTNTAPTAIASSFTTQAETKYMGTLTATDAEMDQLTYSLVDGAANGTVIINANGTYSYTPNAEYTGSDKFSFHVADENNISAQAEVTITVDLLAVNFSDYSRKAFKQTAMDKPLPLNSRKVTQDVTDPKAYDDLLTP